MHLKLSGGPQVTRSGQFLERSMYQMISPIFTAKTGACVRSMDSMDSRYSSGI